MANDRTPKPGAGIPAGRGAVLRAAVSALLFGAAAAAGAPAGAPEPPAGEGRGALVLGVAADGQITVGSERASLVALHRAARRAARQQPRGAAWIRADADTPFDRVLQLIDVVHFEGFAEAGFVLPKGVEPPAPKTAAGKGAAGPLHVRVSRDGRSHLDGKAVTDAALVEALRRSARPVLERTVAIDDDERLTYRHVARTLALCRRGGARRVSFRNRAMGFRLTEAGGRLPERPAAGPSAREAEPGAAPRPPAVAKPPAPIRPDDVDAANFRPSPGRCLPAAGDAGQWLFVDAWYFVGPFPMARPGGPGDFARKFPPEAGVDLDATHTGKSGKVLRWRHGISRRVAIVPPDVATYGVYYAWTEVRSPAEQQMWMAFGCDDYARVWVNDVPVWTSGQRPQKWQPLARLRPVSLRKGINGVLVKLGNVGGTTAFSVAAWIGRRAK